MELFLEIVVPIAGLALAAFGVAEGLIPLIGLFRDWRKNRSVARYRETRAWQNAHQDIINEAARRLHLPAAGIAEQELYLYRPQWRLAEPVGLGSIKLKLVPGEEHGDGHFRVLERRWPRGEDHKRLKRFHQVMGAYSKPRIWFNGLSYRLMDLTRHDNGDFGLDVSTFTYWDGLDSWGALSFEAARKLKPWTELKDTRRYRSLLKVLTAVKAAGPARRLIAARDVSVVDGPYRRSLKDPFDLAGRNCAIGVSVLTIRREESGESSFYLHWRGDAAVLVGMIGCLPAGEFQPSADTEYAAREDLDVWRTVMREFAEEFLESEDEDPLKVTFSRQRGGMIDYDDEESPFPALQAGLRDGTIRPHVLDVGIDPLTWKAGIRLVCVFDAAVFDTIFEKMVYKNAEGEILVPVLRRGGDAPVKGWSFDVETITEWRANPKVTEAMKRCLDLTLEHHAMLGINAPATHPKPESRESGTPDPS